MWLFFVVLIVSRRHWLLSIEVYVSFGCSSDVEQWRQAVQGAYYGTLVYWLVTTMVTWTGLCCAVQKGSPYRVWGYVNWSAELINFIGFFFLRGSHVVWEFHQDSVVWTFRKMGGEKKKKSNSWKEWHISLYHFPGVSADVSWWFLDLWQQNFTVAFRM